MTKVSAYAAFYMPRPGDGPNFGASSLHMDTIELVSAELCKPAGPADPDRTPADCVWIVPGTCPEDPAYEESYVRLKDLRSHRQAYWLGGYPEEVRRWSVANEVRKAQEALAVRNAKLNGLT